MGGYSKDLMSHVLEDHCRTKNAIPRAVEVASRHARYMPKLRL